jgi:hypothetical protein
MALRLARGNTKRIELGDEDYIDVLADISRRQFRDLVRILPRDAEGITLDSADSFTVYLFNLFVKGWSVADEDGKAVPVSEENYMLLDSNASALVDAAVVEHFNTLTPSAKEQTKSEDDSGE